jgi:hypothetical protein
MNWIQEVREHLEAAKAHDITASEHNWTAARILWEKFDNDKTLVQAQVARELGCSPMHITFMRRCWQVFVVDHDVQISSVRDLGSFYMAYNSDEVRKPEDSYHGGEGERGSRRKPGRPEPDIRDYSADGRAELAHRAVSSLVDNPDSKKLLTEDGIAHLRETYDALRVFFRKYGR